MQGVGGMRFCCRADGCPLALVSVTQARNNRRTTPTASLAEAFFGAGSGLNPVFYIALGSGELVCQKRVYHGAIPGETEAGHLRLNHNDLTLEQSCSGWLAVNQKT